MSEVGQRNAWRPFDAFLVARRRRILGPWTFGWGVVVQDPRQRQRQHHWQHHWQHQPEAARTIVSRQPDWPCASAKGDLPGT